MPFFLGELIDDKGKPSHVCPRQLLKKVLGDANKEGFVPIFSQEFEWFNYAETPQSARAKNYKDLTPLTPGMFGYSILRTTLQNPYFHDLFDLLNKFVSSYRRASYWVKLATGVLEAAITHSGILEAADRELYYFKTAVKEIAYQHGIMATFMAKGK